MTRIAIRFLTVLAFAGACTVILPQRQAVLGEPFRLRPGERALVRDAGVVVTLGTVGRSWTADGVETPFVEVEMKAAIDRRPQPVVVIPIGAVEDHGPHLPLSADNDILEAILAEAGRRAEGDLLVLPVIPFGLDEHHMDFPGTIAIDIQTCLAYLAQTTISVARHGFTHILIVNEHGSNASICDLAARQWVLTTGVICAATTVNAAVNPALVNDVLEAGAEAATGASLTPASTRPR